MSGEGGLRRHVPQFVELIQGPAEFAAAFDVSRETLDRLVIYARLLERWQATINLVAPGTVPVLWHRHFADSAQILRLAPEGRPLHWLDLGSGGGFPGLVIAVMLAECVGARVTLMESDLRKGAFLREVVRETGLARLGLVDIVTGRVESAANQAKVGPVDVVSARAMAPLPKLLGWALPYFGAETIGLFLKGRDAELELAEARRLYRFDAELVPSMTDRQGQVVTLRQLAPV